MNNKIITRFAPSPTGYFHIGGARTALFAYLFAKKNNGSFLLRIEDSDKNRSNNELIKIITDGLSWLEINYDKIIIQSNNFDRHREIAYKLIEDGKAYNCYLTKEEIEDIKKFNKKENKSNKIISPYRSKEPSNHIDVKPVIRLKINDDICNNIVINDLIQGNVTISKNEIEDFIILRSDKTPIYHLSCAIDDHDENISHIIRGDDHLTNSFKQYLIYQSLNWNIPYFAHIPLIHNKNGGKMSKRDDNITSLLEYRQNGYLQSAVNNYLLRLGFSYQDKEFFTREEAIKYFELNKIGKSPAKFDLDKLNYLNKSYIKNIDNKIIYNIISDDIDYLTIIYQKEEIINIINEIKGNCITLIDIKNNLQLFDKSYKYQISNNDLDKLNKNQIITKNIANIILKSDFTNIEEEINNFANDNNLKIKDYGPIIRIFISYKSKGTGSIIKLLNLINRELLKERINNILNENNTISIN